MLMREISHKVPPEMKIEPDAVMTMIGTMIAEGIVAFASDDKTLLLLPPDCKA